MPVYAVVVLKLGTLSKDFTALPKGMRFTGYARNCICFRGIRKINSVGVQGVFPLYTDAKETGYPENTWHFRFRHYKNKRKKKPILLEKRRCPYEKNIVSVFALILSDHIHFLRSDISSVISIGYGQAGSEDRGRRKYAHFYQRRRQRTRDIISKELTRMRGGLRFE